MFLNLVKCLKKFSHRDSDRQDTYFDLFFLFWILSNVWTISEQRKCEKPCTKIFKLQFFFSRRDSDSQAFNNVYLIILSSYCNKCLHFSAGEIPTAKLAALQRVLQSDFLTAVREVYEHVYETVNISGSPEIRASATAKVGRFICRKVGRFMCQHLRLSWDMCLCHCQGREVYMSQGREVYMSTSPALLRYGPLPLLR